MKKTFVTSDGKTLVTSDNKTLLSQEKEVSIMAKFQFKIVTGATEAACKSTYDSLVDSTTHLHDPYTFYLFDKGGVGYLGDTPLFGGDASKFNMVSANMVADDLKPENFYFVTADCTITDGQTPPVTHTAKAGSIWVTNNNSVPQELSLSIFTTYMTNYVLNNTIHSDDASIGANFTGDDTTLMTSGAVSEFVNSVINNQSILDISFFKKVESHVITSAEITAGEITCFVDTVNSTSLTASITNADHEGDIGLVFMCQTGAEYDESENDGDQCVFVNLHALMNIYTGSTTDTAETVVADDPTDLTGHTKKISVNVNKSSKTAANYEAIVLAAIDAINQPNASPYDPTDTNGDNLSANKFISESQLAGILVSVLNNFVQVDWAETPSNNNGD